MSSLPTLESSQEPDVLFGHVHIPRTGGISIQGFFGRVLGRERCHRFGNHDEIAELRQSNPKDLRRFFYVGAHEPYWSLRIIAGNRLFCAVVRDPVDRELSAFAYIVAGRSEQQFAGVATFEDYLSLLESRPDLQNLQKRYLCRSVDLIDAPPAQVLQAYLDDGNICVEMGKVNLLHDYLKMILSTSAELPHWNQRTTSEKTTDLKQQILPEQLIRLRTYISEDIELFTGLRKFGGAVFPTHRRSGSPSGAENALASPVAICETRRGSQIPAGPVAIRVRNLSKHYLLFSRPEDRLKQSIVPRVQRLMGRPPRRYYRDFAALRDVSFDVRRGETVGIVGRNGSGKSTLLQIICGTLAPSQGSVEVEGRIAALLELGAGFNPQFTGRENVYLKAAILGLSRDEIDARFDAIARFADIGFFIDQPVKTYSSGMYVRLAFATAINVDPDILVVDEALAVGDEAFRRKCYARIQDIKDKGSTILFVSHGAQTVVQLCDRALLLDGGELILEGKPKVVVGQYQRLANLAQAEAAAVRTEIKAMKGRPEPQDTPSRPIPAKPKRTSLEGYDPKLESKSVIAYESRGALIRDARLINAQGAQVNILETGERYTYEYFVDFFRDASPASFGMLIKALNGAELGGTASHMHGLEIESIAAGSTVQVQMSFDCILAPGTYFLNAGASVKEDGEWKYVHRILDVLAFRVAPVRDLHFTAAIDFGIQPKVSVVSGAAPEPR